jgi:hypothetical protein
MKLTFRRSLPFVPLAIVAVMIFGAGRSEAAPDIKKSIWGPTTAFPTYADLGVGLYQYGLGWDAVAPTEPQDPTNPSDPAYHWPADLDFAISQAQKYGIQVSVQIEHSPPWANGGHGPTWAPRNPREFADFARAAALRYPSVQIWQIWGEPTLSKRFQGVSRRRSPRLYAQLLDASYGVLKEVNPANLVVGGDSITTGQITPLQWIRLLRLPNGRPPRMDMYGHNPYSPRKPNLKSKPLKAGVLDISDLDTLIKALDRYLASGSRNRKLKVFISEWSIPTDHRGSLFGFWADRETVANYLSKALKISRRLNRVYTFGWFYLTDEVPNGAGDEMNWGLLTWDGIPKPAYFAYRDG